MTIAVCPGSFDPVTKGHLDIIRRASKMFDKVIVLVIINPDKHPTFTTEERVEMIRSSVSIENVTVDSYCGLLADYVHKVGATVIVKGLRATTDFEYEFQMALTNKKLAPFAETVFLTTASENMYLSSSVVRQVGSFGGDISGCVPEQVRERIASRLRANGYISKKT